MAVCNIADPILNTSLPSDMSMDVISKIRELTEVSLGSESVYMKAKDTFKELFDESGLTKLEYANLASQFISQLAVQTTQSVMQTALAWAAQEKEYPFRIESLRANTLKTYLEKDRTKVEICKLEKDLALQEANITAILAGSIRKNGRVSAYAADNVTPISLVDEGSEFIQQKVLEATRYQTLADAYRKSGVVQIGNDDDGVIKGTTGDLNGYTNAQDKFARRQILSFEDSKRTHAANAVSQLIGQLLASEAIPAESYVTQWNAALSYLTSNTPAS